MLKAVARTLLVHLGYYPPGRQVRVYDDDIFLVSYPKSGSTWLRFLIASLKCGQDRVDFTNVDQVIPDIYQDVEKKLQALKRPRIIKSHEYFEPRYQKVIYVVRDPRDVAVSYYYHHIKQRLIPNDLRIEEFVDPFLAGTLDPYGSWQDHVGGWCRARTDRTDFLLLRYEDLSRFAEEELRRVAEFLRLEVTRTQLCAALERCSFEEMRRLEQRQAHLNERLRGSRQEILFIRSATVGGWRREMPTAAAERITRAWSGTMAEYGYGDEV